MLRIPLIPGISCSLYGRIPIWMREYQLPWKDSMSIYQFIRDFRSIHTRDDNHIIGNTNAKSSLKWELENWDQTPDSLGIWWCIVFFCAREGDNLQDDEEDTSMLGIWTTCLTLLEIILSLGEHWRRPNYPFLSLSMFTLFKNKLWKFYLFKTMIFIN